jgi:peptide/nickel transport system ATP-binding protein
MNEAHVSTDPSLLDVRGLGKAFGAGGWLRRRRVFAVRDVSFTLRRGTVLAIVGESGSGKSTIARLLAGLRPRTAGRILLDGIDVDRGTSRRAALRYRRRVQMIFQDPFGSLNPSSTIGYHLARPLEVHGIARGAADVASRTRELLATVGLDPSSGVADKYPHQLSGGQRQRVAIARAIACEPEIVLADDPTSMHDVSIRIGILNVIDRLKQTRGLSFVYITHDVASARYLADEILVMYAGICVERGPTEAIIGAPKHPYTQLLLSAVPDPTRAPAARSEATGGALPSATGCPFASRCPHARSACRTDLPAPAVVGADHVVRCHLF